MGLILLVAGLVGAEFVGADRDGRLCAGVVAELSREVLIVDGVDSAGICVAVVYSHKYTFEVPKTVNKLEIKYAVEEVFGVKVAKVNTMNYDGKPKRMGRFEGRRASWKKAIVTLKPDSKTIEFFDM